MDFAHLQFPGYFVLAVMFVSLLAGYAWGVLASTPGPEAQEVETDDSQDR